VGNNHCNVDSDAVNLKKLFLSPFMSLAHAPRKTSSFSFKWCVRFSATVAILVCLLPAFALADNLGPNLIPAGKFENVTATYVPWAGVDGQNNIHCIEGKQLSVGDDGGIRGATFGPSVAVGDLNGDGKPDLVLADSYGFFWYFPNYGTPQKPDFRQGEVIPLWLAEGRTRENAEGVENIVPRIQLVDFDHDGKLDVVAGNYVGKLFRVHNVGSSTAPTFKPTYNLDTMLINTHRKGALWCNFLSPFFTNMFGSGNSLDLIMGEGTYSANSIYLLRNTGSPQQPSFDEDHLQKIIPGMGLEQITPVVIDWNNDGKPDVICGSRTGYVTLYLNTSTDPDHPTFAPGTHIKIAGQEKLGNSITVSIGDLTGNHLPNLLIGRDDGTVLYALNTGTLGAPKFDNLPLPIKGILPPTYHYVSIRDWTKYQAYGVPDELVAAVNPQLEPGFTFPDGENSKYAMKFFVWPVTNTYFPERYYPRSEDEWNEHVIGCQQRFTVNLNKRYRIHFWIKADGNLSDLRYKLVAAHFHHEGFQGYDVTNPVSVGSSWTEFTSEVRIDNPDDPKTTSWNYGFEFRFTGQATFYVDDVEIQEETD
jgi:hypothetical protein